MRPISGFERPFVQWMLVALSGVLIALTAWSAGGLRRASREIERLRAADLDARVQREQLEARLARERSTREALALALARARTDAAPGPPTLTLSPLRTRGPVPPEATVAPPPPAQLIDLRLVLPRGARSRHASFRIAIRSWSGGDTIWVRGRLAPSEVDGQPIIVARVSGDVLQPGAYEVALTAEARDGQTVDVASYELTVGPLR